MTQQAAPNPFKGSNDADPSDSTPSLHSGRYKVKVTNCQFTDTYYGPAYFVNFDVLESSNPEDPKGAARKWKNAVANKDTYTKANKAWCIAASGISNTPENAEKLAKMNTQCEAILLKSINDNVFKGRILYVDVVRKTSKGGFEYPVYKWSPAPQE